MMDDDQDGGIEVEESVEVHNSLFTKCLPHFLDCCKSLCLHVLASKRQTGYSSTTTGVLAGG